MAQHPLMMALAKVIIAAAWADGHLDADEVNTLKNLLAEIGPRTGRGDMTLTANEWAELEIYLYSPVDAAERSRLIADLASELRGPRDRDMALAAIDALLRADRVLTEEERAVAAEIRRGLGAADLSPFGQIGWLIRRSLGMRAPGPNREALLEEFLNNRIYYGVRQRLGTSPADALGLAVAEARKLALAGGLLAQVARVDQLVDADEAEAIAAALTRAWGVSSEGAALVAEVALAESAASLDFYLLTKEFAESTTSEERARFLDALFAVAIADGQISGDENALISRINAAINLTHDQFVAARRRAVGDRGSAS